MKINAFVTSILFLVLLISTNVAAEISGPDSIGADKTLTGKFTQNRYLSGFEAPFKTQGDFFLVPEKGLAWRVVKPFASRLLVTHTGVTQVTHGTAMKIEGGAGVAKAIAAMMFPAFSGDWQSLEKSFDVTHKSSGKPGDLWKITLHPLNKLMAKILKQVDVSGNHVTRSIVIHKSNGDRDVIEFMDHKIWDNPPDAALQVFLIEGTE